MVELGVGEKGGSERKLGDTVRRVMATPTSVAIAQGKIEAIEAVKREFTSNRGHNPLGLPTEVDGKPVELALAPFQGDGEGERHVRGNMLCKL